MSDYSYTQDFVYDSDGDLINNSIFDGTIADDDDDDMFESGDLLFGVHTYAGTMTVDGIEMPVFLRSDGAHHVFNPGPAHVSPPAILPAVTGPGTSFAFCFGEGTLIATPTGEARVETLAIGDVVVTDTGKPIKVKWIGRQSFRNLVHNRNIQPVRLRAGALGKGLPHSDLIVTADHGMIIDGLVINASALVNGASIDWVPMAELPERGTYYHIETEDHDVVLANGAMAETFVDAAGRSAFDNHQEYLDLYGIERIIPEMDRLRISAGRLVPSAIKARLGIADGGVVLSGSRRA